MQLMSTTAGIHVTLLKYCHAGGQIGAAQPPQPLLLLSDLLDHCLGKRLKGGCPAAGPSRIWSRYTFKIRHLSSQCSFSQQCAHCCPIFVSSLVETWWRVMF